MTKNQSAIPAEGFRAIFDAGVITGRENKHHPTDPNYGEFEERAFMEAVKPITHTTDTGKTFAEWLDKILPPDGVGTQREADRMEAHKIAREYAQQSKPQEGWVKVSPETMPKLDRSVWIFIDNEVLPAYYWNFCGKDLFHCNEDEVIPEYWKYAESEPSPPQDK